MCSVDYTRFALPLLSHHDEFVRAAAARALAGSMKIHSAVADAAITAVLALFDKNASGIALTKASSWQARQGAVLAVSAAGSRSVRSPTHLHSCAVPLVFSCRAVPWRSYSRALSFVSCDVVTELGVRCCCYIQAIPAVSLDTALKFLIQKGLADASAAVGAAALAAGREIMSEYGSFAVSEMIVVLEVRGCRSEVLPTLCRYAFTLFVCWCCAVALIPTTPLWWS